MIVEVSREWLANRPERKGYNKHTPEYLLPVVGRFVDSVTSKYGDWSLTDTENGRVYERLFIGSNLDQMECFLKSLYLQPTKPAPNSLSEW